MPSSPLHDWVFAALDRGAIVLTANHRAARSLSIAHAHRMAAQGLALWQPPAIQAWDAWTESLWKRILVTGADDRILLDSAQEQQLWQQLIESDKRLQTLRSSASLAQLAASAWARLAAYNCFESKGFSALASLFLVSEDTQSFARWAQAFEDLCRKQRFLPAAQIDSELRAAIQRRALALDFSEISLCGFDRSTPAQNALRAALAAAGITLTESTHPYPAPSITIHSAPDPATELAHAARTIAAWHAQNPADRIALIVPDLRANRDTIERALLATLSPHLDTAGPVSPRPFELSLGRTLDRLPMVRNALSMLRLCAEPLPIAEAGALLCSPYLAGAQSECLARAAWEADRLRRAHLLRPEISLDWILNQQALPPILKSRLSALRDAARARTTRRLAPYSEWMETVRELLEAAGWPAAGADDRPLTSTEFQLEQRFHKMLDGLATLDLTARPVTFTAALETLHAAAQSMLFAPQSLDAPIQVLGAAESAGSTFDAIWFLGATDSNWPQTAGTHPFLPFALQRRLEMPGSAPSVTLAEGTATLARITHSTPRVVLSYATHNEEGPLRRTPCLDALAAAAPDQPLASIQPAPVTIVLTNEPDAPPPALTPPVLIHSSNVLGTQASCPFRAFAEHRLRSAPLGNIEPGLDAMERGTLTHAVLAAFWKAVGSQAALNALTPQQLKQQMDSAITSGLRRYTPSDEWDKAFLAVQHAWLRRVLAEWLAVERTRPPFTVLHTEYKMDGQRYEGLLLNVRVDRIDEVPAPPGEARNQVLIDYKTGKASPNDWQHDRLESAQLPLYAQLLRSNLTGLAFAIIRPGEMKLSGLSAQPDQFLKTKRKKDGSPFANSEACDLDTEMAEWNVKLTGLAREYIGGHADVDPVKPSVTCRYCAQKPFCRIAAADGEEESDD